MLNLNRLSVGILYHNLLSHFYMHVDRIIWKFDYNIKLKTKGSENRRGVIMKQ